VTGRRVVLHGDFVPENVLLSEGAVHCLDPDLTHRNWAEEDVARFVVMLCDAPLFVTAGMTPPVRALRQLAVSTFLQGYYGDEPVSPLLRPLMLSLVAARWRARHEDVTLRGARFPGARQALVRRHFRAFLDEVTTTA
jgi:Ser/Thr protein kinase RdoA (MazF antagonist)